MWDTIVRWKLKSQLPNWWLIPLSHSYKIIAVSERGLFIHRVIIYQFFDSSEPNKLFHLCAETLLYMAFTHLPKFWPKEYADTLLISGIMWDTDESIPIISILYEKGKIQKVLCGFLFTHFLSLFTHWWMTSFICLHAGRMFVSRLPAALVASDLPFITELLGSINSIYLSYCIQDQMRVSQMAISVSASLLLKLTSRIWGVHSFK